MSVIFDDLLIDGAVVFDWLEYQESDDIVGPVAIHAHESTPGHIAPEGPIATRRLVLIRA